jgi:uncharacterized protein (TIGR02271 family)
MANKPPVHVIPRKNGWAVVREGNERATSVHRTQSEAAKEGRDIARRDETEFLLHANDGRVRDSSDYGTSTTEGAQERAASEDQRQNEEQGTEKRGQETKGGAGDAVGQVTDQAGQAVEGIQDTARGTTDQVQGLVGGLAGGGQRDKEEGQAGPQETEGQVTDQAGQAAQGVQDTAGRTAEEAGGTARTASAAASPALESTDQSAGRSGRAAANVVRGGAVDERTDNSEEVRGVTGKQRDDRFETLGERYASYEVYNQDGERLGKVDHLFLDEDDQPEYVGVETGLLGSKAVLIPAEVIMTYDEQRRMMVSRPRSLVEVGPSFRDQGEVTPGFEERVRRHYGLSSAPSAEGRGGYDALTGAEEQPAGRHGDSGAVGPASDPGDTDELKVLRSEEELRVGTREREAGAVRVRKRVRTDRGRMEVPTRREEVRVDRVPVETEAPRTEVGEGEVRVPVTQEEVVVEKRPVVKEEIRLSKKVVEDTETVEEDVRREEVEVEDETTRRDR